MLIGTGNRVEYRRGDLTEWYVNGSQGLEQGFTLAHRPGTDGEGEPLVIALGVSGGLLPVQETDDGSVLFESGQGVVLRYAGLQALDARGRTVPSRLDVRGREIRLVVEDRAAQYPLVVDPAWTQQQKLTASDAASGDLFGSSVAVSGNTALIGQAAFDGPQSAGSVYVFVQSGGVWTQQQKLTASDGVPLAFFGLSVAVSGDTAVIGAPSFYGSGSAYVFVRSGTVWSQQQELTVPGGKAGDSFGASVSVSGNTVVVGDTGRIASTGAAYVFGLSGGKWSQQQELIASDGGVQDQFGASVSLSDATMVIGASGNGGAAYVFVLSGGVWNQQQKLTPSDPAGGDVFGCSVSLSGNTVVIGAGGKDTRQGAAYVFALSGGTWSQQQKLTAPDGAPYSYFGFAVSLSGNTAAIGAYFTSTNGAVYVFVRSGGTWSLQQELTPSDSAKDDFFGVAIALSGGTLVIGASDKNGYQGAAYVFTGTAGTQPTISGAISAGAFGGFSGVAPGSWVEIYGSNLSATTRLWTGADFTGNNAPTSLDGIQVTIGGQHAFLDYISAGQVNAQLPSNIGPGSLQLAVTSGLVTSAPVNLTVNAVQPGVLAPPSFKIGANQYVVAQLGDGTYVLPAGLIAGVTSRPAKPGEIIVIYGIGFGTVVPNTSAGQIAAGTSQLSASLQVLFGQTAAQVRYAGLTQGSVGLYQFNIVVPQVPDNNLVPISFSLGGAPATQTLYTAVHQ